MCKLFPCGIKQGISFALYIRKEAAGLVTVGSRKFYLSVRGQAEQNGQWGLSDFVKKNTIIPYSLFIAVIYHLWEISLHV